MFPARYFRHLHGVEWLREQYRTYLRRRPRRQLMPEFFRHQTTDVRVFLVRVNGGSKTMDWPGWGAI